MRAILWYRQVPYVAADIEIPERVEVFRSDDTQTDFAYPVKVQAKHAVVSPGRLIGGRWFFGLNGRGYYVKDETLSAFRIEPHVTRVSLFSAVKALRKNR
jgi:hypothetical protein